MKHQIAPLGFLIFVFIFSACLKKIDDIEVNYQGHFAFPVADISFEIEDLLDDSTLTVDDDKGIRLIHREENLVHLTADDFFEEITDELAAEGRYEQSIGKIFIDDYFQNTKVSFQTVLDEFNDPVIQQFIQNNDGNSVPLMAFNEDIDLKVLAPILDEFTVIDAESGIIEVTITNNYFIDIQDFTIIIRDEISGSDLGELTFPYIAKGTSETESVQIMNAQIHNEISVIIPKISSPGSANAVTIDLDSETEISLALKDFVITGGQVRLDGTEIIADSTKVDFDAPNNAELTRIDLKNAVLNYSMKSEFSHELNAKMIFPNVLKNGNPLNVSMTLPPTGVNDSIVGILDFSGAVLMLDKDTDQPFNRMTVKVEAEVNDPPNSIITFDATDKISFGFKMENISIEAAYGYFGQFEEPIDPGNIELDFEFDFLDNQSSPILFENARLKVESENGFGVPVSIDFDMTSFGILSPNQNLNPDPFVIHYPDLSQAGETVQGLHIINKDNSQITEFLSNFPSRFEYQGEAFLNPNGNTGEVNFALKDSEIRLHGELDLPFKFRSENLIYRDTAEAFNLNLDDEFSIDDIESADLKIVYSNAMPFETQLDILTEDENGNISVLIDNLTIESASVNSEGKVEFSGFKSGEIFIDLTQAQIRQMDEAAQNIFEIRLKSVQNGSTPVFVMTDSGINIKAGMKVFLEVK